jgi:hypothetical protein
MNPYKFLTITTLPVFAFALASCHPERRLLARSFLRLLIRATLFLLCKH